MVNSMDAKFYEAEISAADLRIQYLGESLTKLEKAGRHTEANRNRELLALITRAQEFRRGSQRRVQATGHISP